MAALRNVALIVDTSQPYDRKIAQGVAAYAREAGDWSIYVEEDRLQKLPDLRRWRGDGVIADFDDPKVAAAVQGLKIPVVGIGGGYGWHDPASQIPYFASDDEAVARLAIEHFLSRGFKHLAFCGFPHTRINGWSAARCHHFQQFAASGGVSVASYTGRHRTARHWDDLQAELADWLASLPKPVGILACDDDRGRHVLEACRRISLPVPDVAAVLGVDNNEMLCELTTPPLSSIEQGLRHLGHAAAACLDQLMAGQRAARGRFLIAPEQVVARRSTDVLAISDPELAEAIRYLRENACLGIDVNDVVRRVAMSRSTLERRFKSATGRTVHSEIERLRRQHARELLVDTDLTLKEIAARMGFKHLPHMMKLFRHWFGQSPARFRKHARRGIGPPE